MLNNPVVEEVAVVTEIKQELPFVASAYSNYLGRNHKNNLSDVRNRTKNIVAFHTRASKWTTLISITNHAFERWHQRVGGEYSFKTAGELANYLKAVLSTSVQRYEIIEKNIHGTEKHLIEIDKEIVALVEIVENKLIFCTFFGRISIKPFLASFSKMKKYLHFQTYLNGEYGSDGMDLSVSKEELSRQKLPVIPVSQWVVRTKHKIFTIEKYFIAGQSEPVYAAFAKKVEELMLNKMNHYCINPKQLTFNPKFLIPQIALDVIEQDGQVKFVEDYTKKRKAYMQQTKELALC